MAVKAIVTDTIVPSTTHVYKIRGRWYWVTSIEETLESGSQFVMTVPAAKDPRYAQIGHGKVRYVQTGRESFLVRAQDAPVWDWVTRRVEDRERWAAYNRGELKLTDAEARALHHIVNGY